MNCTGTPLQPKVLRSGGCGSVSFLSNYDFCANLSMYVILAYRLVGFLMFYEIFWVLRHSFASIDVSVVILGSAINSLIIEDFPYISVGVYECQWPA